MDALSIQQQVYIRRSDGRIHQAEIIKLDGSMKSVVTVEWNEGKLVRGKDVPLQHIVMLNPQIFKDTSPTITTPAPNPTPSPTPSPTPNPMLNPTPNPMPSDATVHTNVMASVMPRPALPSYYALGANGFVLPRVPAGVNGPKAMGGAVGVAVAAAKPRQLYERPPDDVVLDIERLRRERQRRRVQNIEARAQRQSHMNADPGNPHWEVARMIRMHRLQMSMQTAARSRDAAPSSSCSPGKQHQILVCVRKRPLNRRELAMHEPDVISVPDRDLLVVHELRKQVNLTKFLEHHSFRFDYTFDDDCTNAQVYERTALPLVRHIFEGGMATCFAYGQTGSGKTHTMGGVFTGRQQNCRDGIYALATGDVFASLQHPEYAHLNLRVGCSFFEIYGSRVYDLLKAGKPQLRVLEDGQQQVQVVGLTEQPVRDTEDVLRLLEAGNSVRTSGQTSANSKSSRSHAVFQIVLRSGARGRLHGKFSLIDLAGNERGADNCCADRHTRLEGAEINKSLLALKECIRALGRQSPHLPFRGSKLTQVLRDSFIGGKKVRTCMIAMISPGLHSVENTLNTLRYADRVKELVPQPLAKTYGQASNKQQLAPSNSLPDLGGSVVVPLDRVSSSASLPGRENESPTTETRCHLWNDLNIGRAQQDANLAYFNQVTDNYQPQLPSDAPGAPARE